MRIFIPLRKIHFSSLDVAVRLNTYYTTSIVAGHKRINISIKLCLERITNYSYQISYNADDHGR